MPAGDVIPKKEVFKEYIKTRSIQAVSENFDCSVTTVRKLRDGKRVSRKVIRDAALALKRPVRELIEPDIACLIPREKQFFTDLQCGYFIDSDRRGDGKPCWYSETVVIKLAPNQGDDPRLIRFTGHMVNQFKERFTIEGIRINDHHFSLMGISDTYGWSFDASFTIRDKDVLCGTWSGVNYLENNMAIYRMFISKKVLKPEDLERLTVDNPIDGVFKVKRDEENE